MIHNKWIRFHTNGGKEVLSKRIKDFLVFNQGTWTQSSTDTPQLYFGAQLQDNSRENLGGDDSIPVEGLPVCGLGAAINLDGTDDPSSSINRCGFRQWCQDCHQVEQETT